MGGQLQELRAVRHGRSGTNRVARAAVCGTLVLTLSGPAMGRPADDGAAGATTTTTAGKEQRRLGAPGAEQAPLKRAGVNVAPAAGHGITRTVLSLGLVVGLVLVCAAVAKRLLGKRFGLMGAMGPGGKSPAGLLEILGRYPVVRGQTLVLLKLDRRLLLLSQNAGGLGLRRGAGGGGLTTLCEVTDPDEVASILVKAQDAEGESISAKFTSLLRQFDGDEEEAAGNAETRARRVVQSVDGDRAKLLAETVGAVVGAGTKAVSATPRRAPDAAVSLRARLGAMRAASAGSGT